MHWSDVRLAEDRKQISNYVIHLDAGAMQRQNPTDDGIKIVQRYTSLRR